MKLFWRSLATSEGVCTGPNPAPQTFGLTKGVAAALAKEVEFGIQDVRGIEAGVDGMSLGGGPPA